MTRLGKILEIGALVLVMLGFFVSLELMGGSFKLMGKEFATTLLETTSNPFVGLFIGILATSLIQSSSTVTSMVVTIVAGGGLTIAGAVPIIMGANIGTSVTNTIVSLGHITRPDEFRRAMGGATVHDFFNLMSVAILFPLELMFKLISRTAGVLTTGFAGINGTELLSPLKAVTKPISKYIIALSGDNGIIVFILGVLLLFIALRYLVVLLKALLMGRMEQLMHKYIFGNAAVAMMFGVMITIFVQSSSVTTSILVPLVGSGILSVRQIFPFTLGANIGTTMTAILAALVLSGGGEAGAIAGLHVAFAHLVFNSMGIAIIYPLKKVRDIPIKLAEGLGRLAVKNRGYAFGYILGVFFLLPISTIFLTRGMDTSFYSDDEPAMITAPADIEEVPAQEVELTIEDLELSPVDSAEDSTNDVSDGAEVSTINE